MSNSRHIPTTRGFTLLETLVTLTLVSLVAGMVWQAMGQLARVERMLDETSLTGASLALREQWLRDALACATPGAPDQGPPLQGDERAVEFTTTEPLGPGAQGLERIRLELRRDGTTQANELRVSQPARSASFGAAQAEDAPLLRWAGGAARFQYLDRSGNWHSQWPPASGTLEMLPLAIWLDGGDANGPNIVGYNATSPSPLPTRKQIEAL